MKKLLTGLCALALSAGLVTACSESRNDRLGEKPSTDRTPSASPPTTTPPPASTMPPPSTTTPPSSTSPSDSGSSSSGTKQ